MHFKAFTLQRYLLGPVCDLELCCVRGEAPLTDQMRLCAILPKNSKFERSAFQRGCAEQAVWNGLKLPCQTAVTLSQFNQHINHTGAGVRRTLMDVQKQQASNTGSQKPLWDYYCLTKDFPLTQIQMTYMTPVLFGCIKHFQVLKILNLIKKKDVKGNLWPISIAITNVLTISVWKLKE